MKNILIFTGAGASAPLGLPTTKNFSDEIFSNPEKVTTLARKFLGESGDDIERLLSLLEEFGESSEFTELLVKEAPDTIINVHNTPHHNLSQSNARTYFTDYISGSKSQTKREIKRIKSIVYEKLQSFDKDKSSDLYKNLIKELKETFKDCSITYCTANYDLTLDAALEIEQSFFENIGLTDVDYGFTLKHGKLFYDQSRDHDWLPNKLEYLKIHGSLDWHPDALSGKCVKSGAHVVPRDPDDMIILYPGFKGTPEKEPFMSLHDKLESRINSADLILIIGFAFRDPYINAIFESAIKNNKSKEFILFNPSKKSEFPKDSIIPQLSRHMNFRHIEERLEIKENPLNLKSILSLSAPSNLKENKASALA